jgi:tetratricopeptide (TPR) repeat protein
MAVVLAGCLMAAALVRAQAPAGENAGQGAGQSKADPNAKKTVAPAAQAGQQATPPGGANPFPEDTSNVPVMPSKLTTDIPAGDFSGSENAAPMPGDDMDPVRSPDEAPAEGGSVQELESSSDVKSMDSLLPKPGEEEPGKKGKKDAALDESPKETSKEDITVGKYYLDIKNWKAAQSRFQSALVLAPEDPDVYWGLAESARHLGNFAEARANYRKVMEYDPGSRHAKEAEKALKDPEIENAKAGAGPQ